MDEHNPFLDRLKEMKERGRYDSKPADIDEVEVEPTTEKRGWLYPGKVLERLKITLEERLERGIWRAKCGCCGRHFDVSNREIYNGAYSCGCTSKPRRPTFNYVGREFGRLLVIEYLGIDGWLCMCASCGAEETVRPKDGKSYRTVLQRQGDWYCPNQECDLCEDIYKGRRAQSKVPKPNQSAK